MNSGIVDDEQRHGAREGWIFDLVNQAQSPNFHVQLQFDSVGMQRPTVREIVRPVEEWLESLDPDTVAQAREADGELPELPLRVRDWELAFTALPIKPG